MSKPSKPKLRNVSTAARHQALTLDDYRRLTRQQPKNAFAWKKLAALLIEKGELTEAHTALASAHTLNDCDHEVYALAAKVLHRSGKFSEAVASIEKSLEFKPDYARAHHYLSYLLYSRDAYDKALVHVERACEAEPDNDEYLTTKGNILVKLHRHQEAIETLQRAAKVAPSKYYAWNNLANAKKDIGLLEEALKDYRQALEVNPQGMASFSNLITTLHYHPSYTGEEIFEVCKEWNSRFAPKNTPTRPKPEDLSPGRRIRIGMFSDGFRGHPVGRMTIAALEHVSAHQFEFYFYSTTNAEDSITERFKAIASQWKAVQHLPAEEFAKVVVEDKIDILIDLSGHNAGNRMLAMASQPAPLLVKWVGGLINTTGIEAIDYLISDAVETPLGVDDFYTENLLRLPDGYICYEFPGYSPEVAPLPALSNGYVTLGCFNNPTKINDVVLREWARILRSMPQSRLFLKGQQYDSQELCERVRAIMEAEDISSDRLIIEGPSGHQALLEAYNRVDIALDPWPYSGGLTTCEAMMMGVPVVSLPGPTFAGRHSATHLVNAGMQELVVDSWGAYCDRVCELASDLENLSTIRRLLRQVLKVSPVCDASRFSGHFTAAMRAIWQRYCEGKPPAALTFNKEGKAWFEGESEPVTIQYAPEKEEGCFNWKLPGKVIVLDNSAKLVRQDGFDALRRLNAFGVVAFDPASRVENPGRFEGSDDVQVFPHAVLGDGLSATLYACLDPAFSSTLEPLSVDQQFGADAQGARVLTQLPINTVSLDSIEGLESLDWLILDDLSDAVTILEHGEKALADTLLIQVRVAFQPTHRRQTSLAELQHWMARHGFRFYRFNDMQYRSYMPESIPEAKQQATELESADALFLPNLERIETLDKRQYIKLAFVLHAIYGIKDMSYDLLVRLSEEKAAEYLVKQGLLEAGSKPVLRHQVIYNPAQLQCGQREFILCVGVPVYNEEKYIREALRSLKRQKIENVRFLISDNNSTDGTLDIVCEETAGDDRFEIFKQKINVGASDNFEFVFSKSKSKYFMWLGAHDYLSDNYLCSMVDELEKKTSVAMVMGVPMAIDEDSEVKGIVRNAIYDFSDPDPVTRYLNSVAKLANCTVFHSVFRRSCLDGFEFRKTISSDHILISHLLWGGRLINLSNVSYFRRYFSSRKENQEERLLGKKGLLDREEFYQYYLDDLKRLVGIMPGDKRKKLIEISEGLLRERFSGRSD